MEDFPTRRTGDVRMKLAPPKLKELEELAVIYGMPPATLAAFAVVEWLNGKQTQLKLQRMAVMEISRGATSQMREALESLVDDPEFQRAALTASAPAPLDGEVAPGGEA